MSLTQEGVTSVSSRVDISQLDCGDLVRGINFLTSCVDDDDDIIGLAVTNISSNSSSSIEGVIQVGCDELACGQGVAIAKIREEYVLKASGQRSTSSANLIGSVDKVNERARAVSQVAVLRGDWWFELLQGGAIHDGFSKALLVVLKEAVMRGQLAYLSLTQISSCRQLLDIIKARMKEIEETRRSVISAMQLLSERPGEEDISETSNCKKCCESFGKTGPVCKHCLLQGRIEDYGLLLYGYKRKVRRLKQIREDLPKRVGGDDLAGGLFSMQEGREHEVDGEGIMLLRELRKFINSSVYQSVLTIIPPHQWESMRQAAKLDDERLGLMQHELKLINALWSSHQMLLFAYDDLDQVTG
jgi:hypothetical protein